MPVVEINGHPTYLEDSEGGGPAIVLSRLLAGPRDVRPQVGALRSESRVVTWDERGHGQTPAGPPFTYWDSAADVLAILDHVHLERAVQGGMSQGGFFSSRAALIAPDRVTGHSCLSTLRSAQRIPR